MGLISTKVNTIKALEKGAIIALPNDSTNLSRALKMIESSGLIKIIKKQTLQV